MLSRQCGLRKCEAQNAGQGRVSPAQGMRSRAAAPAASIWRLVCYHLAGALALCFSATGALAQANAVDGKEASLRLAPRNIQFSRISVREGLSQAAVNSIAQDSHGFIWFGTQEGLNRYDGYDMVVFEHDADDPTSLSHDWVWSVYVDPTGTLWVGTDGGGLNRFDAERGAFTHFRHNPEHPHSISSDRVRVIYQDRHGSYWIGTDGGGLNRFDAGTGRFTHYRHDVEAAGSLPGDTVLAIYEDTEGELWVGTDEGLARLERASDRFISYHHDPSVPTTLSDNRVRCIYEDRGGQLWVGTYEGGLNLFDSATGTFKHFQHDPADPHSLSHNRVRDIYQDAQGTLWVATDRGLNEWRAEVQGFVRYGHDPLDPSSLSDDRLITLFQDAGEVLWIGSFDGVNKWNYVSDAFEYVQAEGGEHSTLSRNVVTAIAESQGGVLWIGTYGGGLNRLDLKSGATAHYRHDPADGHSLSDDRVMAVIVGPDRSVWVGTRAGGLNRLDPKSGQFTHYRHDSENEQTLSADSTTSLYADKTGILWVGTYGGGLNRLDTRSGELIVFRHDPDDGSTLSSDRILAVTRDRAGVLWVGTEDGGLNRFVETTHSFVRYQHEPGNAFSLGSNAAWEILEGKDGSLWIGTLGGGLNRWQLADRMAGKAVFKRYRKSDGLKSDTIFGILEDDSGALWLSSNRGLSRFDPENASVEHFDRYNGLKGDEFNFGARLQTGTGQLFFGGTKGLVSFDPEQLPVNQHIPQIVLTAHSRYKQLATRYSTDVTGPQVIELGHRDDFIMFAFAALDYASSDKNQYRYKLEGFDDDWVNPGKVRRAVYTNLPAGNYTFTVTAANNDGFWNDAGASIELRVEPPPWQSPWAYSLYTFFIGGSLVNYRRSHKKKLEQAARQRRKLESEVQNRTRELAERNDELKVLNSQLAEASVTDSLTGLKNRRFLYDHLESEVAMVDRRVEDSNYRMADTGAIDIAPGLFFMMIDLDGFKAINDSYGHHAGDRALLQVRDVLESCCRKSDHIVRWGGDEFMIVGHNTAPRAAEQLAERIRASLAEHQYELGSGHVGRLSGSIGFAMYPFTPWRQSSLSWEQVITLADDAAYVAKQNGRNAWVGVFGTRNSVMDDLPHAKNCIEVLIGKEMVDIKTSIKTELIFSEQRKREEKSH